MFLNVLSAGARRERIYLLVPFWEHWGTAGTRNLTASGGKKKTLRAELFWGGFLSKEPRLFGHSDDGQSEKNTLVCSQAVPKALGNKLYHHLPPTALF